MVRYKLGRFIWMVSTFAASISILCVFCVYANDQNTAFPVPENLKDNIEFWTRVYTSYTTDEVIIHDCEDFIIYEVMDFSNYSEKNGSRIRWDVVETITQKYRKILTKLSRKSRIDTVRLTDLELKTFRLWAQNQDKHKFKKATHNIRAQRGLCDQFRLGLERSGKYIAHIEETLEKYNLPKEISALPMVESSFDYRAYSKMGAAGIWQFTRYTGRLFLRINYEVDERFDPITSTEAAAKLLKLNYDELGTWPLAITAYNHGLAGMRRAKRRLNTDDFGIIVDKYKSRSFGFASKNFYAEFIAAKNVIKNHRRYFGEIDFQSSPNYVVFEVPDFIKLSTLTEYCGLSIEEVQEFNPALRKPVLESKRYVPKGYKLRLPKMKGLGISTYYATIPDSTKFHAQIRDRYYRVRKGDTLSRIADRYQTTLRSLLAMNHISNPHRIHVGQVIEIPPTHIYVAKSNTAPKVSVASKSLVREKSKDVPGGGIQVVETVPNKRVDNATSSQVVTKEKGLSTSIKQDSVSNLELVALDPSEEFIGPFPAAGTDTLTDPAPALASKTHVPLDTVSFTIAFDEPVSSWIVVEPEETLGHYADWLGISTQSLRFINHLQYDQDIRIGQKIKLPFEKISPVEFNHRRTEYHRSIQEDFFARFIISGTNEHKIVEGESLWQICNRHYDVPYWLLVRCNPNINLTQLRVGDVIVVPIINVRPNAETPATEQTPTTISYDAELFPTATDISN